MFITTPSMKQVFIGVQVVFPASEVIIKSTGDCKQVNESTEPHFNDVLIDFFSIIKISSADVSKPGLSV